MAPRMIVFDYCRSGMLDTTTGMIVVLAFVVVVVTVAFSSYLSQ
jgi:hypothetical protein